MPVRELTFKLGFIEVKYVIPEKKHCDKDYYQPAYLEYRKNRIAYNLWAAELYRNSGYATMAEDVPLLVEDDYIKDRIEHIGTVDLKLGWQILEPNDKNEGWFWNLGDEGFLSRVTRELSEEKLRDDYCYRLISSDLKFCPCRYYQYIHSCENIALKTVAALLEHGTGSKFETIDSIFPNGHINPFNLENRYCAVGINTLFIKIDTINRNNSKMYFHRRVNNVEAKTPFM